MIWACRCWMPGAVQSACLFEQHHWSAISTATFASRRNGRVRRQDAEFHIAPSFLWASASFRLGAGGSPRQAFCASGRDFGAIRCQASMCRSVTFYSETTCRRWNSLSQDVTVALDPEKLVKLREPNQLVPCEKALRADKRISVFSISACSSPFIAHSSTDRRNLRAAGRPKRPRKSDARSGRLH